MMRIKHLSYIVRLVAHPELGPQIKRAILRFKSRRMAVWSLRFIYFLIVISIFSDFVANDKPIYCKYNDQHYFPIVNSYLVDLGLSKWDKAFQLQDFRSLPYQSAVFPPIPYSHRYIDSPNAGFISPFGAQKIESIRHRHWLGTDHLGRDIAAGMIHGTRISLWVGLVSMAIASFIGIFLGAIAGYFGDKEMYYSRPMLWVFVLAFSYWLWAFGLNILHLSDLPYHTPSLIGVTTCVVIFIFLAQMSVKKWWPQAKKKELKIDLLIMRLIEIFSSFPTLFVLVSITAISGLRGLLSIIIIIGLLRWTGIARYVRGEMIKVRTMPYIDASKSLGFSNWYILWHHALPNALLPVVVIISFGISSAILLEAFLSFLGIGVPIDEVTWGSMLQLARSNIGKWWIAILPGVAIFLTVAAFNIVGDAITDALDSNFQS